METPDTEVHRPTEAETTAARARVTLRRRSPACCHSMPETAEEEAKKQGIKPKKAVFTQKTHPEGTAHIDGVAIQIRSEAYNSFVRGVFFGQFHLEKSDFFVEKVVIAWRFTREMARNFGLVPLGTGLKITEKQAFEPVPPPRASDLAETGPVTYDITAPHPLHPANPDQESRQRFAAHVQAVREALFPAEAVDVAPEAAQHRRRHHAEAFEALTDPETLPDEWPHLADILAFETTAIRFTAEAYAEGGPRRATEAVVSRLGLTLEEADSLVEAARAHFVTVKNKIDLEEHRLRLVDQLETIIEKQTKEFGDPRVAIRAIAQKASILGVTKTETNINNIIVNGAQNVADDRKIVSAFEDDGRRAYLERMREENPKWIGETIEAEARRVA